MKFIVYYFGITLLVIRISFGFFTCQTSEFSPADTTVVPCITHQPFPVEGRFDVVFLVMAFNDSPDTLKRWPYGRLNTEHSIHKIPSLGFITQDNPLYPGQSGSIRNFFSDPIDIHETWHKLVIKDYFEKMSYGKFSVNLIIPRPDAVSKWVLPYNASFFPDRTSFFPRSVNDSLLSLVRIFNNGQYASLLDTCDLIYVFRPDSPKASLVVLIREMIFRPLPISQTFVTGVYLLMTMAPILTQHGLLPMKLRIA